MSSTHTIKVYESVTVGSFRVKYVGSRWIRGVKHYDVYVNVSANPDHYLDRYLVPGGSMSYCDPADASDCITVLLVSVASGSITVEITFMLALAFADVAVSRRYGNRLYLSGTIEDITESDEICVYFQRPGDTGIRNLKSDTSDYLYFSGTSGSYDLGANGRYLTFDRSGYHWLKIWDVDGNCETPVLERASWLMDIVLPRFQYQLIFDLEDPDLGDNLYLLEAEYAKFEAAGWWEITHEDPDCFPLLAGHGVGVDETPQSGWLSLGVEFGESPCAPVPYYLCPYPTPQTQYWRGECSCDDFKNTLQPLGIPCWHLLAAMKWYSGETPWSDYVKCP